MNAVTMTFLGEDKLSGTFDKVGKSADAMQSKVKDAGNGMAHGFDKTIEGFDTLDTRAMGFRDTITGLQDSMTALRAPSLEESQANTAKATAKLDGLIKKVKEYDNALKDEQAILKQQQKELAALNAVDSKKRDKEAIAAKKAEIQATKDQIDATKEQRDAAQDTVDMQKQQVDALKAIEQSSLSTGERLLYVGAGVGDLASGFANLLGPALKSAALWFANLSAVQAVWNGITVAGTAVMKLLNAAFISSPIGWVVLGIGAIVTAFIILWEKSAAFRDFFIGVWNGIKDVVGTVVGWIVDRWNSLTGFFQNNPLGQIIVSIFKAIGSAIGAVVDAIKWLIDRIRDAINWAKQLIGQVANIPGLGGGGNFTGHGQIKRHHTGGVVPGMLGSEQLAILQAGERVTPRGQASNQGSGGLVISDNADSLLASFLMGLERQGIIQWKAA
jgi:hypothetical protein